MTNPKITPVILCGGSGTRLWPLSRTVVAFTRVEQGDFISLTDIARVKNPAEPKDVVKNWLRTRSTVEYLGLWEKINKPKFKGVEFDAFTQRKASPRRLRYASPPLALIPKP